MLLAWTDAISQLVSGNKLRIILASASPRRKEILRSLLLSSSLFTCETSQFEETLPKSQFASAGDYALATAKGKAEDVAKKLQDDKSDRLSIIIGADTVVALDKDILEKPSNDEDARRMMRKLSGKVHFVHTGVIILCKKSDSKEVEQISSFICSTKVKFADLSEETISAYVATKEPMDKAGGYGIQGAGRGLVEWIEGDFFNVVGFPCFDFSKAFAGALEGLFPDAKQAKKAKLS